MSAILDLVLDRPGRHTGALRVAHSDDRSAYGEIVIPLVSLIGGAGPCVLLSAGIHGDEAEGPLALMRLLHGLESKRFGRAPGPVGIIEEPGDLARRTLAALMALGQERTVVVSATAHGGTLTSEAIAQGKLIAGTEIGGAGGVRPETVAAAERAVRRFLAHLGLLPQEQALPTRLMRLRPAHFVRSPARGLFDPTFTLGDTVRAGEIAGFLYDADRPWRAPEPLRFEADGLVVARGVPAMVEPGDVVVHLAEDTDEAALLPR